jgi:hypothetical protein
MSDTATELTPIPETPPAVEPQAQGDGDSSPLQIEDDAAVDAAIEQTAIAIPGATGEKLIDGEQATQAFRAYRGQIKDLKGKLETANTSAARASELEQQIASLSAKVNELQPYVSAYQAMTQAAQQATPNAEEDTEAEEYARLLDLYTNEGKPDIERGKKGLAIQRRLAETAAQKHVAPLQQQSVQQKSDNNVARLKATVAANPNFGVDAALIDALAGRMEPGALANPETAKWLLATAIGVVDLNKKLGQQGQPAARTPGGQFVAQTPAAPLGDPMFTERAGGKTTVDSPLDDKEKAYIKSAGISEKDYMESVKSAPWLKRG